MSNTPKFQTMKLSSKLRFVERDISHDSNPSLSRKLKILQQAHVCLEDGKVEWVDVPLESEME